MRLEFTSIFLSCLQDDSQNIRELAVMGLCDCEDRSIITPLINLLSTEVSSNVKAAVAASLGTFSAMAQDGKLIKRDATRIMKSLIHIINDPNEKPNTRANAIESVSYFNNPAVSDIILEAYSSGVNILRQSAICGMGKSSDNRWLGIVLKEMKNTDPDIRFDASNSCGLLGGEQEVPNLIDLLEDDSLEVRLATIQSLSTIGGDLAKAALLRCLKSEDDELEAAANAALKTLQQQDESLAFPFQH